MQPPVYFHFPEITVSLRDRTLIKKTVNRIFKAEGKRLQRLDYVFCSDKFLLDMNKQWLQHDTYTDIITFDLSEPHSDIRGEVYISIDRVKENALKFSATVQEELCRVIFHGALHLCGHGDKTKAEQQEMRKQENRWLKSLSRST